MSWRRAHTGDSVAIGNLAGDHYTTEIDSIFTPMPAEVTRRVAHDIIDQIVDPMAALVMVYEEDNVIRGYTWAARSSVVWSNETVLCIQMAHLDLTLPGRQRVKLVHEMIDMWLAFCVGANIKIIMSSTVRDSQDAFLKIHEKRGFLIKGSFAFYRL